MRVLLLAAVAALLVASSQGLIHKRKTVRPRSRLNSPSQWSESLSTLEHQELGREVCDGCTPGTKPQHPLAGVVTERKSPGLKIAGGSSLWDIQDAPWVAMITMDSTWTCGGSLISETYVLTSAQCASGYDQFKVGLGDTETYYHFSGYVYAYTYKSIVHEKYEEDRLRNDIGLIELLFPLTFSDKVRPIKLPSSADASETFVGKQATVTGWGSTSNSGGTASGLRYAVQPIMDTQRCIRFYPDYVTKENICGDGEGGISTCESDGGDPLTIKGDDGVWKLIGVSSFQSGLGCTYGYPSVYTRVTEYLKWISSNTNIQV